MGKGAQNNVFGGHRNQRFSLTQGQTDMITHMCMWVWVCGVCGQVCVGACWCVLDRVHQKMCVLSAWGGVRGVCVCGAWRVWCVQYLGYLTCPYLSVWCLVCVVVAVVGCSLGSPPVAPSHGFSLQALVAPTRLSTSSAGTACTPATVVAAVITGRPPSTGVQRRQLAEGRTT